MQLYFLRHGRAVDPESWTGADFDRPLTKDGSERMAREAKTIARLVDDLDRILTSPLVRARQTADIVADELSLEDRVVEDERLGAGFDLENLRAILSDHNDGSVLMLVGHEPGMSATVSALIGGGSVEMKKGGLARVDLSNAEAQRGTLAWLTPPKVLRG